MKYSGLLAQALRGIFIYGKDIGEIRRHISGMGRMTEVYDENGKSMLPDLPDPH